MTEDLFVKRAETVQRYHMLHQGDRVVAGGVRRRGFGRPPLLLCALREQGGTFLWRSATSTTACGGRRATGDEAFVRQLSPEGNSLSPAPGGCGPGLQREGRSPEEGEPGAALPLFLPGQPLRRGRSARKIATAHTLTDSMETVFFHLAREPAWEDCAAFRPGGRFPPAGIVWRALPRGCPEAEIVRPLVFCSRRWWSATWKGWASPSVPTAPISPTTTPATGSATRFFPPCTRSTRDLTAPLPVWRSSTGRKNDYLNGLARALLTQAGYVREHPSKGAAPRSLPRGEPVLRRRAALLLLGDWGLPPGAPLGGGHPGRAGTGRAGLRSARAALSALTADGSGWIQHPSLSPEEGRTWSAGTASTAGRIPGFFQDAG